ncbi:MAG: glycosyltransferase family 9 protein, partial [Mycobacteriales bacterium]
MRVLVLRALGLGDLLTAVPALRALRRAHPDAHLQLACPQVLTPLALRTGAVDEVVDAAPLSPLPAQVAGADLAVNLHGRGPQSTALLEATGPQRLVAWGAGGPVWRPDEHEVRRWCRLLTSSGVPADPADLLLDPVGPRGDHVVVHPGAAKPSRRWPADRWAEVVRRLPENVVVTAGPGERPLAEQVVAAAGRGRVAEPDLDGLVRLVGTARLLVAPDTGVAHLATALSTPSVLLFGPTPPALWGPPADRPGHVVLWAGRQGDESAP